MPKPKDEALAALRTLLERFRHPAPLDGLEREVLRATARYAIEQVEAIQEVKRARKTGAAAPGGATC